jgi:HrpA-like RNA helicase
MRVNLTTTVLTLKSIGISDILNFDYMDAPNGIQLEQSLKQLFFLEALDSKGNLTDLGHEISKFPLEPTFSKALLFSFYRKSVHSDMLKLLSVLSSENIWLNSSRNDEKGQKSLKDFKSKFTILEGDHYLLVQVFDAWIKKKA